MTPMTLTEKRLARHAGRDAVKPGDNIWIDIDVLMTHDVCGPGTIGVFKKHFGPQAKVWDRDKVVIIPDHYIFTADSKSNRNVDILRDFVKEQGIPYFYDVIDDANGHWVFDSSKGMLKKQYGSHYAGVCHTALPQKGHTRPGEILFGTDSHTCMAGAFNQFATGIGNTDAGFVMGTGKLLIKVPETMHFRLEGKLQPGVMAKDIILHCIGEIGFDGATYRAMQFDGEGALNLSIDDRMTIANMAIDPVEDADLISIDASHLFPKHTTWIGFDRSALLRKYMYDFLSLLAPHLDKRMVDKARPGQILLGDFETEWRDNRTGELHAGNTLDFVEKTASAMEGLKGAIVGEDRVERIRCYLTGERLPEATDQRDLGLLMAGVMEAAA